MAEILKVVPSRTSERQRVSTEITELAGEVREHDAGIALLLDRLAEAVKLGRPDDARGYAAAVDPRAAAEAITAHRSQVWALLEIARNVLVFAPIALTWYGLSTATDAYSSLLAQQPDLSAQPFLLLWERGFGGVGHSIVFSTLAAIDATLIGLLILLTLMIHLRADIRDARTRAAALLKESQIRATIAHATSLAASGLGGDEADELLDQMAAEERRVFERAMEREQQLYDLEGAIGELRKSAADLARAAEALSAQQRVRS
ncbi:MAG: hypothetical protein KGN00_05690 [Chloroflexota bacterium]|nr:hypothetical protein [Chloroflexota bacterium]